MSDLRKAAEMALEVMEYNRANGTPNMGAAIEALRQALAQPEQEPVAWVCYGMSSDEKHCVDYEQSDIDAIPVGTMLYTSPPPKREWIGLTEEERDNIINQAYDDYYARKVSDTDLEIIKNTDAKLKEKNT